VRYRRRIGSELWGGGAGALAPPSESNLSATLYFCTVEPTWKLISVCVPPRNLPLIRLPFFNCSVSAHAIDAAKVSAVRNQYFSLSLMMCFPSMPLPTFPIYKIVDPLGTHLEPNHCLFNMIPSPSNPDWFNSVKNPIISDHVLSGSAPV
jgi:hypothetical protein